MRQLIYFIHVEGEVKEIREGCLFISTKCQWARLIILYETMIQCMAMTIIVIVVFDYNYH